MSLQLHPEFAKVAEPWLTMLANSPKPKVHDVESRRANLGAILNQVNGAVPPPADVEIKVYHTKADDGHSVPIYHFRKTTAAAEGPTSALLHTHGGGYVAATVPEFQPAVAALVSLSGMQVFSVDYRLAPEHPFPVPFEDAYAGLLWLNQHAAEFNVDPARIAVYGESAGGGLAAGLAVAARDRKLSPPLAKQILVYPMIDDRNLNPVNPELAKLLFWGVDDNVTGWTAYLGDQAGKEGTSPYAAAARVESVEGLPRTYLDCGNLDLFVKEDLEYVSRLNAAAIDTEVHIYPGLPHAFELTARGSDVVKVAFENRIKAMHMV